MTTARSEFLTGIKNIVPILMGVVPFGLIYGVAARSAGIPVIIAQAMSFIVFAGSAQFVMVQLISANVPVGIIILTASIINLRHVLYSASVAPYLKRTRPFWQLLLAYLLTDEAYAIAISHYSQRSEGTHKHWYFLGAGLALWSTWQVSTAVGILLGTHIAANWSLDFTLPLTFIALVIPSLRQRADGIVAITAGVVAVLAASLPFNSGLIVATFAGITVGLSIEARSRKGKTPGKGEEKDCDQIASSPESATTFPTKQAREERGQ